MDVFYYWKDLRDDLKAGRIGRFRSSKDKLDRMRANCPSYVWIFKTPQGQKGRLQLLARLVWSNAPPPSFTPAPGDSHIFYDPDDLRSVWYDDSDDDAAVERVTDWVRQHFPAAVRSNFQGGNGQHEMRGAVVQDLKAIAKDLTERAFRKAIA